MLASMCVSVFQQKCLIFVIKMLISATRHGIRVSTHWTPLECVLCYQDHIYAFRKELEEEKFQRNAEGGGRESNKFHPAARKWNR